MVEIILISCVIVLYSNHLDYLEASKIKQLSKQLRTKKWK